MTPRRRAEHLERSALRNFERLIRLSTMASAGSWDRVSEDIVSYVAIEAQNTWGNFVRAYVLSCWRGVRLRSGAQVGIAPTFPPRTENEFLGWAINRYRKPKNKVRPGPKGEYPSRDEPAWFKLQTLLDLVSDMGCSNEAEIRIAVSSKPTVFGQLPTFRNFFAHRNRFTQTDAVTAASSLGLPSGLGPASALVYRPPTRSVSTLDEWLLDLQEAVKALCA